MSGPTIRLDALPELSAAWSSLERDAAASFGIQLGIADDGGMRTEADTLRDLGYRDVEYAAYVKAQKAAGRPVQSKNDWRPIKPFGSSYHNYGAARDGKIVSRPRGMSYDDAVAKVRSIVARNGLRGISSKNDPLHFELPIPITEAKARWEDYQARRGRYAAVQLPAVKVSASPIAAAVDQVTEVASDAVDQVADAAEKLTGGLPPIATAFIAAVSIGILGAIVARRFMA